MFDDEPVVPKAQPISRNLELMSIDELTQYIEELKQEITRTEEEIVKKKASIEAASSVFKT